ADFDEEGYRRASLARGEAATHLLETIVGEHEQLARLLETLPDAAWSREGRHPSLGAMSIEFLARRIGEHAEEHAAQIAAAGGAGATVRRPSSASWPPSQGARRCSWSTCSAAASNRARRWRGRRRARACW